jgi:hypothetical protein
LAVLGAAVGLIASSLDLFHGTPSPRIREYPLPHHIPKYEGGVSLRFAMVHDVIHERFPRHGDDYYRERNRIVRHALTEATSKPLYDSHFALLDDLGAGLDYLKEHDEAVRVLRDKLRQQEAMRLEGRQLYTTYANLGTFLIHGNFRAARAGNAAATERLREGLAFIHQSIAVNPQAHFGREVWQAVAGEFLLAAIDNPKVLLQYDLVGNALAERIDPSTRRSIRDAEEYGEQGVNREVARYLKGPAQFPRARIASLRTRYITQVGALVDWEDAVCCPDHEAVPFDEPTLGIVGMWRLGGGANPHFALALGEIMIRVGQRHIAWCAYERAAALAGQFWPDPELERGLVEHCRRRQATITESLPRNEVARLRPTFEAELAYGEQYQREYQEYEAEHIRGGVSIDDPHFYDDFHVHHESIVSAVGTEESYLANLGALEADESRLMRDLSASVLFAGVVAFTGACLMRWEARRHLR